MARSSKEDGTNVRDRKTRERARRGTRVQRCVMRETKVEGSETVPSCVWCGEYGEGARAVCARCGGEQARDAAPGDEPTALGRAVAAALLRRMADEHTADTREVEERRAGRTGETFAREELETAAELVAGSRDAWERRGWGAPQAAWAWVRPANEGEKKIGVGGGEKLSDGSALGPAWFGVLRPFPASLEAPSDPVRAAVGALGLDEPHVVIVGDVARWRVFGNLPDVLARALVCSVAARVERLESEEREAAAKRAMSLGGDLLAHVTTHPPATNRETALYAFGLQEGARLADAHAERERAGKLVDLSPLDPGQEWRHPRGAPLSPCGARKTSPTGRRPRGTLYDAVLAGADKPAPVCGERHASGLTCQEPDGHDRRQTPVPHVSYVKGGLFWRFGRGLLHDADGRVVAYPPEMPDPDAPKWGEGQYTNNGTPAQQGAGAQVIPFPTTERENSNMPARKKTAGSAATPPASTHEHPSTFGSLCDSVGSSAKKRTFHTSTADSEKTSTSGAGQNHGVETGSSEPKGEDANRDLARRFVQWFVQVSKGHTVLDTVWAASMRSVCGKVVAGREPGEVCREASALLAATLADVAGSVGNRLGDRTTPPVPLGVEDAGTWCLERSSAWAAWFARDAALVLRQVFRGEDVTAVADRIEGAEKAARFALAWQIVVDVGGEADLCGSGDPAERPVFREAMVHAAARVPAIGGAS